MSSVTEISAFALGKQGEMPRRAQVSDLGIDENGRVAALKSAALQGFSPDLSSLSVFKGFSLGAAPLGIQGCGFFFIL